MTHLHTTTTNPPTETTGQQPARRADIRRLAIILVSHTAIDVYSAFVPPIVGILQVRTQLTDAQAAWIIGIGSLCSGLSQPLSAWISDRFDTRRFGMIGLLVAAVCLSGIGFAENFTTLVVLYSLGMIGVGVFHPVGASTVGQITENAMPGRRSLGVTFFFIAGMLGGISGSVISSRLTTLDHGFSLLALLLIPGAVIAFVLHRTIREVPHRHHAHAEVRFQPGELRARWLAVAFLYVGNAVRFIVNVALIYLVVRFAESVIAAAHPALSREEIADAAAPIAGNLQALMMLGMAIGGLAAGLLVRAGGEKWPIILIPILMAPCVALLPRASLAQAYILAVTAGIGFAALIPVTIGLAQRLLPHRTMLASGLMLGGAWALAISGPRLAEWCLDESGGLGLGLQDTFALAAILLAASGLVGLGLRKEALRGAAV